VYQDKPEPRYHIKYAESVDGIAWDRQGIVSIDYQSPDEAAIARSSVIKEDGLYKMWYSYRGLHNYRSDKATSYRMGYAESLDGICWTRKDDFVGIAVSPNGWDSEMIAYPYVYIHRGQKVLVYNGNGFENPALDMPFWKDNEYR
jgi:hypothetical protein